MVIENLAIPYNINDKAHYIIWEYGDFYSRWNGYPCYGNVWIVPGTIKDF